jgi:hypothetical protein
MNINSAAGSQFTRTVRIATGSISKVRKLTTGYKKKQIQIFGVTMCVFRN